MDSPRYRGAAEIRLFCFPYAGAGAAAFRTWQRWFPPEIEIRGIDLPGRASRWAEPPLNAMAALVAVLAGDLAPLLDVPFAFFGHSMGALVAFELARHLRRRGRPLPFHLIVSAARAPQIPDPEPPLSMLPDGALLAHLIRLNGFPAEILRNPEFLKLMLPVFRADITLCDAYRPAADAPLECPISAFGGLQDNRVPGAHLAAWKAHTQAAFRLRFFPGDHFYLSGIPDQVSAAVVRELSAKVPAL